MSTSAVAPTPTQMPQRSEGSSLLPQKLVRSRPLFDPEIVARATRAAFAKLSPATLIKNPVMFVVEVGAAITTIFLVRDVIARVSGVGFQLQIAVWLWFTVLFANFAEAMAEARGKAQAETLRKTKTASMAKRIISNKKSETVPASRLRA